jgi:Leucine-rich repeat (LRR) protein
LNSFNCGYNQLTDLDIAENTGLIGLNCSGNMLTSLDVSNNTILEYLACNGNSFATLDLSNNTHLSNLSVVGMPSLHMVCVFKIPTYVDTEGSPNTYLSTDCVVK